jgi:hypothetical protein
MERIRELTSYQKFILIILVLLVLGFGVLYGITTSRVGYEYEDSILVPTKEGGNTVYSGEIDGMPVSFTVTADNTVTYQYGLKTYGPYTVIKDETAVPKGRDGKGVEVRLGDEILFRGSAQKTGYGLWLTNEDGTSFHGNITISSSNGIITDENGNIIDQMAPSVSTLLELVYGPELTHKGSLWIWFFCVVLCIASAVSILFADELFRWNLSFRVRYAYDAEPSDWEIATRYIGWTLEPILILIIFIVGLQ